MPLMTRAIRLYQSKFFLMTISLFGWVNGAVCTVASIDTVHVLECFATAYKNIQEYDQDKDDEQLMAEIWDIGATLYKNAIDMSALYFSGILLDSNQLYDRMMFDLSKNLFQVVKLLAWYGPKMMKNPHISWKIKAKKTAYMVSFLIVFWIWSQEMVQQKQGKDQREQVMHDMSSYRSVRSERAPEEILCHRPRPSAWS